MATATPMEGETFAQFLARLGIEIDEFYNLNPDFAADRYVAGQQFAIPENRNYQSTVVPQPAPVASSVSHAPAAPSDAPSGLLGGGAQGLFEQMLKDFRKAFQTYLSAPSFIQNMDTATAGAKAGKGTGPGWSTQEAEFLRQNEDVYSTRYEEQVQRQLAENPTLSSDSPSLMPDAFLRSLNPRTDMEMRSNEARGGRAKVPYTGVRRLRF